MHFVKYTYPDTWTLLLSLNILAAIVIGGIRSIPGTILGSFVVFGVPDLILKRLPVIGQFDGLAYIFNGGINSFSSVILSHRFNSYKGKA